MQDVIKQIRTLLFALIIIVIGSYVIVAQEVTGTWTARVKKEDSVEKLDLSFELKRDDSRGKHQNGSSFSFSDLQGLSPFQATNGPVNFRLVREAGTVECEGSFTDGKGAGTFRFLPSRAFLSGMRDRGFDFEKRGDDRHKGVSTPEERQFVAALLNVTTALADDLRSANFPELDVDDLFKAAIFKIDGKFMAEMAATGFPDLTMEDLVKARIFKIDTGFVRGIKDMGFGADDFDQLVKYSIFKVTPQYLAELRSEGITDLTGEEVVKLRIFKIDAAYIREARAQEPNITIERIVQKKIGVWGR
jgi:hypothetical protein